MSENPIATGLSYGAPTGPRHATQAVERALDKAGISQANSVLLFLTSDFAQNPQPALRAAARAAGCIQVVGATGAGLITDEEWVLDSSGAAALVLGGSARLNPAIQQRSDETMLTLTTPAAMSADWLDSDCRRIGAVSTDLFGHGPFAVWTSSRLAVDGLVEVSMHNITGAVAVAQGIRALTSPIEVAEVEGFDIRRLGNYPALNVLVRSLPHSVRQLDRIPLHLLMCGITFGDPDTAIRDGRFRLNHIVSANVDDQSITLSDELNQGEWLFWAMRDKLVAERRIREAVRSAADELERDPEFALLFPCMSRGPSFFGNRDKDLDTLKNEYPGLPIIGFYSNGEIAPLEHGSHLYHYSTALGLFYTREPD